MKLSHFAIFGLACILLGSCIQENSQTNIINMVDPFIGTGADGNTWPAASMPLGGVQLGPDTRLNSCGGYASSDSIIQGFTHTHLNGVGEPEYRDVLFMPATGKVYLNPMTPTQKGYGSFFDHQHEKASPGFYSVLLKDFNIQAELTTTLRAGFHQYTFPQSDSAHIVIDLAYPFGAEVLNIKKISDTEIEGLRRSHGWAWDQYVYFVSRFSKPFTSLELAVNDTIRKELAEATGKNIKAVANFQTKANETILVKVGISAVSAEGARKNLYSEIPDWDFDGVKEAAELAWEKELSKIEIEGGTDDQRKNFYTAMYHAHLSPCTFSDVDGQYRGVDHQIHRSEGSVHYTVFSLWDTYRALHPLFTIVDQKRTTDFIKSLLQMYDDGGRLPMWPLAGNYTDDMLGYHSVPVIVDAYMKGIRNYDVEKAFKAVKHSAENDKLGLKYYKKIGYLPFDRQGESVSKTLEYCYDDWCISQMAKAMGQDSVYETYHQRAHYWENVFDPSVGFMRGKSFDRTWLSPFDPLVNSAYSEGNAYQYMYVPHDVDGLAAKFGSDKAFVNWIDTLFTLESKRGERGSIGQYWHGNEPGQQLPYLYNYVGEAWKTQKLVNRILNELYTTEPDGLAGNDDCGQISAWYILSSMGFYPVAPGQTIYAIGSPLFAKTTIHLENGKAFEIKANNVSKENVYIQSARLNGEDYNKSFLKHEDLMEGGELVFEMGPKPNENWGSAQADRPYSENGEPVVQPPYIKTGDLLFSNSTVVELDCETQNSIIRYTLDSSEPTEKSMLYEKPFEITTSTLLKIRAFASDRKASQVFNWQFEKAKLKEETQITAVKPGMHYDYFEKFFVNVTDLDLVQPVSSGITNKFSFDEKKRENYFGFRVKGFIKVPKDGIYTFYLKSNDGSRLYIDGDELIENDANHAAVEEPGILALKAGLHPIEVKYMQCGGGKALTVSWSGPGMEKHEIQPKELFRKE
ncbi:MAG: GH92 family glycosyl hydrolase [Prolixibacteraceae bacterium]|nr:GH92 family glycosyl hydrolase [Prolixibacteraceae bacterium]